MHAAYRLRFLDEIARRRLTEACNICIFFASRGAMNVKIAAGRGMDAWS